MRRRSNSIRCLSLAIALVGCGERGSSEPITAGTPVAAAGAEQAPKIVDICGLRYEREVVCVLLDDGRVSCARILDDHFPPPLAGVHDAVELSCGEHSICMRSSTGEVHCIGADGKIVLVPELPPVQRLDPRARDSESCVFTSRSDSCMDDTPERRAEPGSRLVEDVVLSDQRCVVDVLDRVWCKPWTEFPPVHMRLTFAGETRELAQVVREGPTVKPKPLPDPAASTCPRATAAQNRICTHLSQPGGPLACVPGRNRCPRTCVIHDEVCEPAGFYQVTTRGIGEGTTYLVYVDGPQVWLGPVLTREVAEQVVVDATTRLTRFEFVEDSVEETPWYDRRWALETAVLCGLVDGIPACSPPLVRSWDYFYEAFDVEQRSPEQERYEADIEATSTGVTVKVKVKAKQKVADLVSSFPFNREDPPHRILGSGRVPLDELLSQRFVELPAP